MKTTAGRPRTPKVSETDEHRTIASWLRKVGLGGCAIAFHVRNERPGDWQRLNAHKMGILEGCPDWIVVDGGGVGFLELKPRGFRAKKLITGKINAHEQRQIETHNRLKKAGAWVEIVETLEEFIAALLAHSVPVRSSDIVTEGLQKHLLAAIKNDMLDDLIDEGSGP